MADPQNQGINMEISKDALPAQYPQFDANPPLQNHEPYPVQQYQPPPPGYGQQYPVAEPQQVHAQVVVQQQPQRVVTATYSGVTPHSYIAFSITCVVLTGLCIWPLLVCTIPALIFSIMSKDRSARGDLDNASNFGKWALGLNIAALVAFIVLVIIAIIISVAN